MRTLRREEVYVALDGERDYQSDRWNEHTTTSHGFHSVTEFLTYMQDYLTQAIHEVSRNADPEASIKALHTIRKITALGVAAMEQNGVVPREGYEGIKNWG